MSVANHAYLCLLPLKENSDKPIDNRKMASQFPGLTHYKTIGTWKLPDDSDMVIIEVKYNFADIPWSLKNIVEYLGLEIAFLYKPEGQYIQASRMQNIFKFTEAVKIMKALPEINHK